jgi:hypothetical protein
VLDSSPVPDTHDVYCDVKSIGLSIRQNNT